MTTQPTPARVRTGHVAWLADRLSPRDWAVLATVNRLHLVTGGQLQRLHFADLATEGASRSSRARTLARLVRWRILLPLPRRIGGQGHGSAELVYALDTAGNRLLRLAASNHNQLVRIRRPAVPGERWTNHVLDVAKLYVELVEVDRVGRLTLRDFRAEPAAWWPDGLGGWLKPDAYTAVSNGEVDHLWWIEVDRGTESLPTVQRKLRAYLDFDRRGGVGPRNAMPRLLVTVPTDQRRHAIARWIKTQPAPAGELLHVSLHEPAVRYVAGSLDATAPSRRTQTNSSTQSSNRPSHNTQGRPVAGGLRTVASAHAGRSDAPEGRGRGSARQALARRHDAHAFVLD